jgi:NAD(P)-dependent dehydrogenase (short-subunit alcohol dehydrogenase family)
MTQLALITGVCGGIGRATARAFAALGWRVIGIDLRDEAVPELSAQYRCDVSKVEELRSTFEQVARAHQQLHALINNAALQLAKPLADTSEAEWDLVMNANVRSAFLAIKYALPLLAAGRPSAVVNVSSVHAIASSRDIAAYAASKGALLALTRAAAIELAERGIRVNAVLPGAIDTPMLREGLARGHAGTGSIEERLNALAERTVMGRVGKPEEIAELITFLARHEQSSFVTGQAFVADGGATCRLSTE